MSDERINHKTEKKIRVRIEFKFRVKGVVKG
jgi:hypothetical protein